MVPYQLVMLIALIPTLRAFLLHYHFHLLISVVFFCWYFYLHFGPHVYLFLCFVNLLSLDQYHITDSWIKAVDHMHYSKMGGLLIETLPQGIMSYTQNCTTSTLYHYIFVTHLSTYIVLYECSFPKVCQFCC